MKIKTAKYRVGQKATTYQTNGEKCLIVECVIRWHIQDHERTNYNYAYRLELPSGQLSNWTSEININKN